MRLYYIPSTFFPPYRGVVGQVHHRLKRTTWQFARTRAVEKVYNNLLLLLCVVVPYIRPLLAKNARKIQEKEYKEFIKAIKIYIKI